MSDFIVRQGERLVTMLRTASCFVCHLPIGPGERCAQITTNRCRRHLGCLPKTNTIGMALPDATASDEATRQAGKEQAGVCVYFSRGRVIRKGDSL